MLYNPIMEKDKDLSKIVNFLFEIGTMKKLPRIHQQVLLSQDMSDNIASHSYRVFQFLLWITLNKDFSLASLKGILFSAHSRAEL